MKKSIDEIHIIIEKESPHNISAFTAYKYEGPVIEANDVIFYNEMKIVIQWFGVFFYKLIPTVTLRFKISEIPRNLEMLLTSEDDESFSLGISLLQIHCIKFMSSENYNSMNLKTKFIRTAFWF